MACPGCGLPLDETTDEKYPYTYEGRLSPPCIACEVRHETHREHMDERGHLPTGTFVSVRESDTRVNVSGSEG